MGNTAFARLTIDTNHFLIRATDVGRINRQIGDIPGFIGVTLGQALMDGVLVTAGESREYELSRVRMARVNRQLRAFTGYRANLIHVSEIQHRVHALTVEIHRHSHDVHIARPLTVAQQRAFHPVCTRHHTELGSSDRTSPIVVGMQGDDQ